MDNTEPTGTKFQHGTLTLKSKMTDSSPGTKCADWTIASHVMPGTSEGGGLSPISVVVTTVITPTSITASESPTSSDNTRRRVSPIKLVGVGGLERQNYCCGHWFPSSKSFHRHLAEKALVDLTHEMKLIELGMLRCAHCSMWVHVDNMSGHLRKSHGIIKVNKTSKIIPGNTVNEISGISADTLKTGTNFVIKVSGQSAVRSSNGEISSSMANSSTVKLVTTSSGSLYHKVHQLQHAATTGMGKVIVHKSTPTSVPVVSRGPRIVMKSVGRKNVIPLGSTSKGLSLPKSSQAVSTAATTARNINGLTTVQITGGNMTVLNNTREKTSSTKSVVSHDGLSNMNGQSFKFIKKIANVKTKNKTLDSQPTDASPSTELPLSAKTKEKGKVSANGETAALKPSQVKKSRKQVLKPSIPDVSYDANTSLNVNGKIKKRGKKQSAEAELFNAEKVNSGNPSVNHKGHRRKSREAPDSENYTPKTSRQTSKGVRGGLKKKKRGPGRPRKIRIDETPDLSEIDSLFDEVNKEDLENEPVLKTKKEEENVPTVELDLFTLPSLNEQVSVLLTEPQNPNFKVYASMDAIFVGDSALGDVTNQIGYVTDANNVVYVNPSHFLFPNVEDLENFVPSPILTMKGSKVGFTPVRQMWKLNANKAHTPVVLRDNKFITLNVSKEASKESNCDVGSEKVCLDDRESQVASVSLRQNGKEKLVKDTNVDANQTENVLNVKPLRIVKSDVGQDTDCTKNVITSKVSGTSETETSSRITKEIKALLSPKRRDLRRRTSSQSRDGKEEEKAIKCSEESLPVLSSVGDISLIGKGSPGLNQSTDDDSQSKMQSNIIFTQEVISEGSKSPVILQKTSVSSSVVTEALELPNISDMEETTQKEEVQNSVTPCKLNSESTLELETPLCFSQFKSGNTLIVPQELMSEDLVLPVISKTKQTPSPCNNINNDALIVGFKENETEEALKHLSQSEMNHISPVADLDTPKKKDMPRRRRRRSRTKSADTVGRSMETRQGAESGCNDKDDLRHSRRKTRQLSESSVIMKETKSNECDRLSISDMTYRLRMEHLPLPLGQQNKKEEVFDDLVEQMSYPVTPSNLTTTLSSTECRTVESVSPERESKYSIKTRENRETPVMVHNEAECKTPVRLGRQRRRSSKLLETLGVEPLKIGTVTAPVEEIPLAEKDGQDRLSDQEKAKVATSVRDKQLSSKSIDSMTVISHSLKRASPQQREDSLKRASPQQREDSLKRASSQQWEDSLKRASPQQQEDSLKRASPQQQEDSLKRASPQQWEDSLKRASQQQEDSLKKASSQQQEDSLKKASSQQQEDRLKKASPQQQEDRLKRASSQQQEDSLKKASSQQQEDSLKKASSQQQEDSLKRASSQQQEDSLKKASSQQQEDSLKKASSQQQEDSLKRASSQQQEDSLKKASSQQQEDSLKKASSQQQEDSLKRASSQQQEDSLKKASSQQQEDSLKRASQQQEDRLKKASSQQQEDSLKRASSQQQEDRLKKASSQQQEDSLKRASSSSQQQEDSLKRASSQQQEDSRKKASSQQQEDSRKRASSQQQEDSRKKASSQQQEDSRKRASSQQQEDSRKKAYSQQQEDRLKRASSQQQEDRLKRASSSSQQQEDSRKKASQQQEDRLKKASSQQQEDRLKRASSSSQQQVDSLKGASPQQRKVKHLSTDHIDKISVQRQEPVDDTSGNPSTVSQLSCKHFDVLSVKTEEENIICKEKRKTRLPRAEISLPVSPLRESDLSPSREWHGRGAKLKAQVLIQDQQAGVIDSQIIPTSNDRLSRSKETTPASYNTKESSSPKLATSPSLETRFSPSTLHPKSPGTISSPISPNASRSPKSPRSVHDREWQARGAKLKAQIMISDQQNSMMEFTEDRYSPSPPAKKLKIDNSPGTMKDIRSYFAVQKSPTKTSDERRHSASSSHASNSTTVPKKTKKYPYMKSDIRSFLSSSANTKRKYTSPEKSYSKNVKAKKITFSIFPKKSPKKENVQAVHHLRKKFELLGNRTSKLSAPTLPIASCDFEGFDRCSRQSGLRAKSLLRLVSLLDMKRWYHLGKFPLPVDELCDWDDELLSSILFD
ncbi:titin homolog isoform X2 [Homarus americanus]|uniref:titin homolog isoform X2 n=1 Tax=Homarus americanus TaxID=6706 RepID=UPI001C43EFBC|nr:titin homolog isoform X2 [Homarus americanus]